MSRHWHSARQEARPPKLAITNLVRQTIFHYPFAAPIRMRHSSALSFFPQAS